ncbi:MAG TPA: efflux RND transporter periplasmic adaptor subunit [Acidobacteriota bacterium]
MIWIKAITVSVLLALLAFGCAQPPAPEPHVEEGAASGAPALEPEHAMPAVVHLSPAAIAEAGIRTWKVQPVNLAHLLVLNGSVGYNEDRLLELAANVRGRAAAIHVDLGQRVRKGDPVLTIESVELGRAREDFLRELSELRVAAQAYERAQALVKGKAISAGEYETREGSYLAKKAAADAAERTLHLYGDDQATLDALRQRIDNHDPYPSASQGASLVLKAPFDARVIERKVTPGSLFEAMQPLVTLADLSSVWVFLEAYEKDLAALHLGLPVTLQSEAYPQQAFSGTVDFLASVVDPATRTVKLRATVPNPEGELRPGMFITAQIDVPRPQKEAHTELAVPQAALQTLEGRTVVFVETAPGEYVRRPVEVGHTFEGFTEVLGGIQPDERIVTEGSFILKSEFARASLVEEH